MPHAWLRASFPPFLRKWCTAAGTLHWLAAHVESWALTMDFGTPLFLPLLPQAFPMRAILSAVLRYFKTGLLHPRACSSYLLFPSYLERCNLPLRSSRCSSSPIPESSAGLSLHSVAGTDRTARSISWLHTIICLLMEICGTLTLVCLVACLPLPL